MRFDDGYLLRRSVEQDLRERIQEELQAYGFKIVNGRLEKPELDSKEDIRQLHSEARREKYESHRDFLEEKEEELLECFAHGNQVDVDELRPRLQVVEAGTIASDLFRYATLLWSVPVSQGFGRRVRFLVWDRHIEKLIGLFAVGDPVFNLSCRDEWIGWNHDDRAERLYNLMDIFVLGAVPPYNILLGGKLIAMLATSNKVRRIVFNRYKDQQSIIQGENKDPTLAALTTGSALGRSSIYNRIRYGGRSLYQHIGTTNGWGHFHVNDGLFSALRRYLHAAASGEEGGNRFGDGPNWKLRTVKAALRELNMSPNLLRHGIRREIYGIPLAENYSEFLRGDADELKEYDIPFDEIANYWKDRWLRGRAERKPEYRKVTPATVARQIHSARQEG